MTWVERAGYQHLEDIEPITVAAYIETLQRQAAAPTVKRTRLTNPPTISRRNLLKWADDGTRRS